MTEFPQCAVEGCASDARRRSAQMCEKHYYRQRRTGTTADRPRIQGTCLVDGCSRGATSAGPQRIPSGVGYCRLHAMRIQKHGDPHFEFRGDNTNRWTGDDATSRAVHQRVRAMRGSATSWSCVDCSRPAAHWSYDHADPAERYDPEKGPFSVDLDRYFPRCVKCHKRFDLDHLNASVAS